MKIKTKNLSIFWATYWNSIYFSILKIKKIENWQLKNPKNIYFYHFDFFFLTNGENFP
jgi:hypothetical protein